MEKEFLSIDTTNENTSSLLKELEQFSSTHKIQNVFADFLKLSAISISNSVDKANFEPREQEYLGIISKYSKADQALFPKMFASLVLEMESFLERGELKDVLGCMYEDLHMGSKTFQQYFTPEHISKFMAEITNPTPTDPNVQVISDSTCGSGRLIYAYAEKLQTKENHFQDKLKVFASDIDLDCVHMAYIQCSLYAIPAVICHENSLSKEVFAQYKTPAFVLKYEKISLLENLLKAKETVTKQEKQEKPNDKKLKNKEISPEK